MDAPAHELGCARRSVVVIAVARVMPGLRRTYLRNEHSGDVPKSYIHTLLRCRGLVEGIGVAWIFARGVRWTCCGLKALTASAAQDMAAGNGQLCVMTKMR